MRDIKIHFNGDADTRIDLTQQVEGKNLYEQKCLLNIATEQGSDPLYSTRGTALLEGAIGGMVISSNDSAHLANFAAIDTIFFVSAQEYASQADSPDLIVDIDISPIVYSSAEERLDYGVQFKFADGTETKNLVDILTTTT